MRKLSWMVGAVALVASGGYLLVYVYRWEWHRALLVGVLFNACLVGLCAALVLRRLSRVERQAATTPAPQPADPLARLRAAPVEAPPFRWLGPAPDRTHVFIPILLGGGALLSGAAWLVERVAGSSARAGIEEGLARELREIAFPAAPLVPGRAEVLAGTADTDAPGVRLLLGPVSGGTAR